MTVPSPPRDDADVSRFLADLGVPGIVSNGVIPPIELADVLWVSPILLMIGAGVAAVTGYVTLRLYVRL